ncbi:MAG TPA: hypothetical protein VN852_04180 [Candidatus Krumholzibacteria bacterium]|jgi:hypothetical protein|nr:hypothetical protein [Candidatus Krumholzibacteria bacterium]
MQTATLTWENPFPPVEVVDIWGASSTDIHAVGSDGQLLHFDGKDWKTVDSPTRRYLGAIFGVSPNNIVAVGPGGTILRFNGQGWTSEESGTTAMLVDVWGNAEDVIFAISFNADVLRYDGTSWIQIPFTRSTHLQSVWGTGADDLYVGGDSLYHYDGNTWTSTGFRLGYGAHSISGSSAHDVWVAEGTHWLRHYDGAKWEYVDTATHGEFTSVWVSGKDVFAAGWSGVAAHYDGIQWQEDKVGEGSLRGVWANSGTDAWMASANFAGSLRHFDGEDWGTPGDENERYVLRAIWSDERGDRAVSVGSGMLMQRQESKWEPLVVDPTMLYDAVWSAPSGEIFVCGPGGSSARFNGSELRPFDLATQAELTSIWGTSNTNVYMGAIDYQGSQDGLWHYDGVNWTPTSIHDSVRSIWGTSPVNVLIAGSDANGNGVVKRFNGFSWNPIYTRTGSTAEVVTGTSNGELFVSGYEAGEGAWVQHFNGTRWSDITPPMDVPIYAMAAGDGFGLVASGYGATPTLHYHDGKWEPLEVRYTAYFFSACGFAGGVYLAGGAHIVRAHY